MLVLQKEWEDSKVVAGIYKIYSLDNLNRVYYGSSVNLRQRFRRHRLELSKGVHKNSYLQRVYNKNTNSDMVFEVVEITIIELKLLRDLESQYINSHISIFGRDNLVNVSLNTICALDDENVKSLYRQIKSDSMKERWKNSEYRKKCILGMQNYKSSEECKKMLSENMKKRWEDPEFVERQRNKVVAMWENPEFKDKMSKAMSENNSDSEFTRKRLESLKTVAATIEFAESISKGLKKHFAIPENLEKRQLMLRDRNIDEEFQKFANARSREICAKRVICEETKEIFEALSDAGRWLFSLGKYSTEKCATAKVCTVCKKINKTAGGYTWNYVT